MLCSQALDHPELQEEPQKSHIQEYASLLMDSSYEGGDAELEWFANHYQTELILIDVSIDPPEIIKYGKSNQKIYVILICYLGKGQSFPERAYLCFDSDAKYSVITLSPSAKDVVNVNSDLTTFSKDSDVMVKAKELAVMHQKAQYEKKIKV